MTEQWTKFEEELTFIICSVITQKATAEYWDQLKTIFLSNSKNEQFLRGLNRVII